MAEAEPLQPAANRRAVRHDAMLARQFQAQLIQSQIALPRQAFTDPSRQPIQLACPAPIACGLAKSAPVSRRSFIMSLTNFGETRK